MLCRGYCDRVSVIPSSVGGRGRLAGREKEVPDDKGRQGQPHQRHDDFGSIHSLVFSGGEAAQGDRGAEGVEGLRSEIQRHGYARRCRSQSRHPPPAHAGYPCAGRAASRTTRVFSGVARSAWHLAVWFARDLCGTSCSSVARTADERGAVGAAAGIRADLLWLVVQVTGGRSAGSQGD